MHRYKPEGEKKPRRPSPPHVRDEEEFRIRPRRPPAATEAHITIPPALGCIYAFARQTARHVRGIRRSAGPCWQRCAVRVTYVGNRVSGQWRAHGRYLSRESATHRTAQREAGFDEERQRLDVARRLDEWQGAADPRLWKIIISPEFSEKLDMPEMARAVMAGVEREIGVAVEWVAVAHYNTGHPHVHIAMRGLDRQGREIRLAREFVQHGIRKIAEGWCTERLGYRTKAQSMDALRREVSEIRFTSLDRIIVRAKNGLDDVKYFSLKCQGRGRDQFVAARLAALEAMGLARRVSADVWEVRSDLHAILAGMQKMADRQRTLRAGGALPSDDRLPIVPLDHRALDCVEGRILVHGEEENGRSYMMLESTDYRVYAIYHSRQMQEMRKAGALRVNTFVRLRGVITGRRARVDVDELGTAETILENRAYLRQTAQQLARRGLIPAEPSYGGWLGRYQQAVHHAVQELGREREEFSRGR